MRDRLNSAFVHELRFSVLSVLQTNRERCARLSSCGNGLALNFHCTFRRQISSERQGMIAIFDSHEQRASDLHFLLAPTD